MAVDQQVHRGCRVDSLLKEIYSGHRTGLEHPLTRLPLGLVLGILITIRPLSIIHGALTDASFCIVQVEADDFHPEFLEESIVPVGEIRHHPVAEVEGRIDLFNQMKNVQSRLLSWLPTC